MDKKYTGTVSNVSELAIEVRFESDGDGEPFFLEYPISDLNGLNKDVILQRGDQIEAHAILIKTADFQSKGIDHLFTKEELDKLDKDWIEQKGVVGDIVL